MVIVGFTEVSPLELLPQKLGCQSSVLNCDRTQTGRTELMVQFWFWFSSGSVLVLVSSGSGFSLVLVEFWFWFILVWFSSGSGSVRHWTETVLVLSLIGAYRRKLGMNWFKLN